MHLPIKIIFITIMMLCVSSCTVGGAIIDGALGTNTDDDDGGLFQGMGREADKSFFKKDNKEQNENLPCKEPGARQVCSYLKGCSCVKQNK